MKHFAYPATIFSCVKQPLQGNKRKRQKTSDNIRLLLGRAPKPPTTGAPRRHTDSKAHPPPLIRLRFESTSSAPSMATSSCRERRNSVWKPHPHGLKVLLSVKTGGELAVSGDHPGTSPALSGHLVVSVVGILGHLWSL